MVNRRAANSFIFQKKKIQSSVSLAQLFQRLNNVRRGCLRCREVCGQLKVRFLSRALFTLRKLGVSLRSWRPRGLVNFFLQAPTRKLARVRDTRHPCLPALLLHRSFSDPWTADPRPHSTVWRIL